MFCGHSYHKYLAFSIMGMSSVSENCMFYAEFHINKIINKINKKYSAYISTITYIKSQLTLKVQTALRSTQHIQLRTSNSASFQRS